MIEKRVSNVGILYITHSWIGQCANSKLVTDTGCHVALRIHLIHSMPTFDTLSLSYTLGSRPPSVQLEKKRPGTEAT